MSNQSLRSKAETFVASGAGREIREQLLREAIVTGGVDGLVAVQLMYEDMYGGFTYNFEEKAPAAYCLLRWGKPGLNALLEGASRTNTSKNASLLVAVLSELAAETRIPSHVKYMSVQLSQDLISSINNWDALYRYAATELKRYLLSLSSDEEVAGIVGSALSATTHKNSFAPALSIFSAVACRWTAVGYPVLNEFENLIATSPHNEPLFQAFLRDHPLLLDPLAARVWPQPDIAGAKEPDFLVQRTDNSFLVIEIETPGKLLVTGKSQISAESTAAISQACNYVRFLMERIQTVRQYIPQFSTPDSLVVIGLENQLSEPQRLALAADNSTRVNLRLRGFDYLLARARAITDNVVSHRTEVLNRLRIV